jgi:hypothetical protein
MNPRTTESHAPTRLTVIDESTSLLDAADQAQARGELLLINGRHTITSPRPLSGWFRIVVRVPQTIRHQEPTCAN